MYRTAPYCDASNCRNCAGTRKDLRFFRFPKDKKLCSVWIKNCGRKKMMGHIPSTVCHNLFKLCSEHFTTHMFKSDKKLIPNAIPTIFPFVMKAPIKSSMSLVLQNSIVVDDNIDSDSIENIISTSSVTKIHEPAVIVDSNNFENEIQENSAESWDVPKIVSVHSIEEIEEETQTEKINLQQKSECEKTKIKNNYFLLNKSQPVAEPEKNPFEEIVNNNQLLKLPKTWGLHVLPENIVISECRLSEESSEPYYARVIKINKNLDFDIFYCSRIITKSFISDLKNFKINTLLDVRKLIEIVENTAFCNGGPKLKEFSSAEVDTKIAYLDSTNTWRHKMCTIISIPDFSCTYCNSLLNTLTCYKAKIAMKLKSIETNKRQISRFKHENSQLRMANQKLKRQLDGLE